MNYEDALYWFMLQPAVALISISVTICVSVIVSLLLILRKWGDYA